MSRFLINADSLMKAAGVAADFQLTDSPHNRTKVATGTAESILGGVTAGTTSKQECKHAPVTAERDKAGACGNRRDVHDSTQRAVDLLAKTRVLMKAAGDGVRMVRVATPNSDSINYPNFVPFTLPDTSLLEPHRLFDTVKTGMAAMPVQNMYSMGTPGAQVPPATPQPVRPPQQYGAPAAMQGVAQSQTQAFAHLPNGGKPQMAGNIGLPGTGLDGPMNTKATAMPGTPGHAATNVIDMQGGLDPMGVTVDGNNAAGEAKAGFKMASLGDQLVGYINSWRRQRPETPKHEWLSDYYHGIQAANKKYPDENDPTTEEAWQNQIYDTMAQRWPHKYHENATVIDENPNPVIDLTGDVAKMASLGDQMMKAANQTYYHGSPQAALTELREGSYVSPSREIAELMGRYHEGTGKTWDDSDLATPHKMGEQATFKEGQEPTGQPSVYSVQAGDADLDRLDNPYEHLIKRILATKQASLGDTLLGAANTGLKGLNAVHQAGPLGAGAVGAVGGGLLGAGLSHLRGNDEEDQGKWKQDALAGAGLGGLAGAGLGLGVRKGTDIGANAAIQATGSSGHVIGDLLKLYGMSQKQGSLGEFTALPAWMYNQYRPTLGDQMLSAVNRNQTQ